MSLQSILDMTVFNATFWVIVGLLSLLAYSVVRNLTKRIPVVNRMFSSQMNALMFSVLFALLASGALGGALGGFSGFGTASLNSPTGMTVSDLQVTTSFATDAGGTIALSQDIDDRLIVRMTDAQANETAGYEEVATGIITVTRVGSTEPMSCDVVARLPADYENQDGSSQGTFYNIVEKNTLNEYEVYLEDGGAATTSSPKERTSLEFADGAATGTLGISIEVDEEGHDALLQYNSKFVTVDICGKPFEIEIVRMD